MSIMFAEETSPATAQKWLASLTYGGGVGNVVISAPVQLGDKDKCIDILRAVGWSPGMLTVEGPTDAPYHLLLGAEQARQIIDWREQFDLSATDALLRFAMPQGNRREL